jgi:hypothetical protein
VKNLLVAVILIALGCSTATPTRDAQLVLHKGRVAIGAAIKQNDYPGYYKAISDMREGYRAAIGPSPLFEHWMDLYVEAGKISEAGAAAQSRGEDPAPYKEKIKAIVAEMHQIAPVISAEIQQAQRDENRRAESRAATMNAVGAILGAFAGAAVGAAASAPSYQPQTNCTTVQQPGSIYANTHCY